MRLDSFELSKIAGGFLCALLVIVGFRVALEIGEHGKAPEKPGYVLPTPEAAPARRRGSSGRCPGSTPSMRPPWRRPPQPPMPKPALPYSRSARPAIPPRPGGPNKVGPNLAGVVGRPKASHAGFGYSDAMKAKGGNWTLDDLASFIHSPKTFVPGTKMLFPGIADAGDLGDLLAYLNTLK